MKGTKKRRGENNTGKRSQLSLLHKELKGHQGEDQKGVDGNQGSSTSAGGDSLSSNGGKGLVDTVKRELAGQDGGAGVVTNVSNGAIAARLEGIQAGISFWREGGKEEVSRFSFFFFLSSIRECPPFQGISHSQ